MVVSVFHKDLECQVEKLKYKKLKVMQWGSKTNPTFEHVNKQSADQSKWSFTVLIEYSLSFISEE